MCFEKSLFLRKSKEILPGNAGSNEQWQRAQDKGFISRVLNLTFILEFKLNVKSYLTPIQQSTEFHDLSAQHVITALDSENLLCKFRTFA